MYYKSTVILRGGKIKTAPGKKSGYSSAAWYTYAKKDCDYGCQAIEYLWWGYCAYSGMGNGLAGGKTYTDEFKHVGKKAFLANDVKLAKLFKDSESKTASYRLPNKPVDGTYTGCKICKSGRNHGGNYIYHS